MNDESLDFESWHRGRNGGVAGIANTLPSVALPLLPTFLPKHGEGGFEFAGSKFFKSFAVFGVGASCLLSCATVAYASDEAEHGLECPSYSWPHNGILSSYDPASIRRGHQVYQQVRASCHSVSLISYRDPVCVAYTEEETKAMAAEVEVVDDPNDEGPPQWSELCFALRTGYRDPLAGVTHIHEGLYHNPYFPGGEIVMPKMLNDGAIEYEDGTPATEAQMGKDVVTFLPWDAEPDMEERKLMADGFQMDTCFVARTSPSRLLQTLEMVSYKSRKLVLDVVNRNSKYLGF